jgi:ABC-type sugar transport system ATPase subunit
VVVLRDGSVVGELAREQIHRDATIRLTIGRDLKSLYIPPKSPPGECSEVRAYEPFRTRARNKPSMSAKAKFSASPAWSVPGGPK